MDARWDDRLGLIRFPLEQAPPPVTSWYALGLLQRDERDDRARAAQGAGESPRRLVESTALCSLALVAERSHSRRVRLLVVAAAAMLFIAGAAFAAAKLGDEPEPTRAASGRPRPPTTVPRPTTTLAPTTTPPIVVPTVPPPVTTARPPVAAPRPASPATVVVPNLLGMRLGQATSATSAVGLSISWPAHCDDVVSSQSPSAGKRVSPGTRVVVELVPCVVPNLVGMRLQAAKDAVAAANLRISWPDYCDDVVRGQSPAAGTKVDPGTTVSVQLAPPGSC